jgi:hypothetical protein
MPLDDRLVERRGRGVERIVASAPCATSFAIIGS